MNIVVLIIILCLILVVLIALNNLRVEKINTIEYEERNDQEEQATCMYTHYGCCPDGVNSKINIFGTNCPRFT